MKKKVLFVATSLYNGGAERSLVNLLNELVEYDYDLDLLLFRKEGMFLEQLSPKVNVISPSDAVTRLYGPVWKSGKYCFTKIVGTLISSFKTSKKYAMRAYRWMHFYKKAIGKIEGHYDIAVGFFVGECTYLVTDAIDADRKIGWVHTHYGNAGCDPRYDRVVYGKIDSIATISEECAESLRSIFSDNASKVVSIPNIISAEAINSKADAFYPKEYDSNVIKILSIGRLIPLKGFDLAISAADILRKSGYKFKWYLVGNGLLEKELKKQVNTLQLEDTFCILGSRDNPYPYIKNADIVVQTSRYEGKSMVLDEAKILGTPIVTTNYETVYDQICDGKEGIIVNMDPQGIADGIKALIDDSDRMQAIKDSLKAYSNGNKQDLQMYIDLFEGKSV